MPVRTEERQYRAMLELRAGVLFDSGVKRFPDSQFEVQGFFTTWNQPYAMWGDISEEIDRHALDEADLSDVIMQYDHAGKVLARQSNGTLVIDLANNHGPFMAADLSRSQAARELYEEIQAELITRMSWAFTVLVESFNVDTNLWSVMKVKKVFDVSAVSIPANDATEISARARLDGAIETKQRESRARKVLELLTRL
jgi:HK97 family phage prohead protease